MYSYPIDGFGFMIAPENKHRVDAYPIELAEGDRVTVQIQAKRIDNECEWQWETKVTSAYGSSKADFRQSTFEKRIWSPNTLRRRAPMFTPKLSKVGEVDRFVLHRIDGQHSLQTIAGDVTAQFPKRFATNQEALDFVAGMSERYSE